MEEIFYIDKLHRDNISYLFKGWEESLIWSCLQGVMGEAWADDVENAKSAQILLGDFCYFAGEPNESLLINCPAFHKDSFVIMVPQNEKWSKLIEKVYGSHCKRMNRYAIKHEKDVFDRSKLTEYVSKVSSDYEIKMIDEVAYDETFKHDWSRDLCAQFPTWEDYEQRGMGVCIYDRDELVAGVSSYSVYQGGIEIEIDTREDYRRQGLALAGASKLILHCLDHDLYPCWDAQNLGSVAVAEKLGYHYDKTYPVYEVYSFGQLKIKTERSHLYAPDINVAMKATISKEVTSEQWPEIISKLTYRHPLLTATIQSDENNEKYYQLHTSEQVLIDESDVKYSDWIMNENKIPFDFSKGPLWRIHASVGEGQTSITILGHHILGDGRAYEYLMQDLLKILDGTMNEAIVPSLIIQSEKWFNEKARANLSSKMYGQKLSTKYEKSIKFYTEKEYRDLYNKYIEKRKPALAIYQLTQEETQKLVDQCHQHKVTVNEALTTAFTAVTSNNRKKINAGISCDIRKELLIKPGRAMGNYASAVSVYVTYKEKKDFWANAKRISEKMRRKLLNIYSHSVAISWMFSLDSNMLEAMNFVDYGNEKSSEAKKVHDIYCGKVAGEGLGISNLGATTLLYNNFELKEFVFIPPMFGVDDFIAGIITVNGEMKLCIRYCQSTLTKQAVDEYMERLHLLLIN